MSSTSTGAPRPSHAWFVTTHWSVVLSARDKDPSKSVEALEKLCRTYWYPLYAFARRQGQSPADAEDLTQEFFARLLQKDYLQAAAQEKGRFRTFLLVAFKRFLANEWDRFRAQKRGGGAVHVSLETENAEERYGIEAVEGVNADRVFERRWALTLLERTMNRLRNEFVSASKAEEFERLKSSLTVQHAGISYADIARDLRINEGAARVAVHRLRKRYRDIFRDEIAQTVSSPEEIDAEIQYLLSILGE
ncbi:MAG: hypothetical protein JWM68_4204 [Verrucomicrobiales bacterium]|nr:hypothetical protein [Verrucomicrobiales bacterium]